MKSYWMSCCLSCACVATALLVGCEAKVAEMEKAAEQATAEMEKAAADATAEKVGELEKAAEQAPAKMEKAAADAKAEVEKAGEQAKTQVETAGETAKTQVEGIGEQAKAAVEAAAEGAASLKIGELDLGKNFQSAIDALKGTLDGVTNVESAQAALPKLEEANLKLDSVLVFVDQIPEAARPALAKLIKNSQAGITQSIEKVVAIEGVGAVLKPVLDQLVAKLEKGSAALSAPVPTPTPAPTVEPAK
ncbi:hypothetical protein ETAA8_66440 [Anatilimnocola aggregata]|uniref:Uncharacterized protein n=1 Tax=Anatilimnocola aggregata TaxID=2528021 RepID=A0A517YMP2_9BACT|nr:hypothetical protein [Anatilimnocola aggregata]QDU31486.1 hypothetical protein ETAA8_66440 [Anatilimnocola aggregata]